MAQNGDIVGGRYRVLAQIGEGGMSRVYLALDTVLNKQWAAKEIKRVDDPTQRDLIVNSLVTEANMIKRFDHPAIPRIVDIIDEDGTLYVIMDYVEGHTLEDMVADGGSQSEDDVVDWGLQLCDVLEYLHQRKPPVIYRDMKPANVMLKPNGLITIIDFGIAREYREGGSVTAAVGDTVQLGTRGFAPPEQYGGSGQTDARTDVYALGATLYNLVTGKSPAEPPYTILPVRQVRPELSPGFERIVAKATQANPDDRYQDCAEMAYDLAHYREQDDARKKKLRRTWHGFVGLVAASLLSLAVGVGGTVGVNVSINNDYSYWMNVARQASGDEKTATDAYVRAAAVKPGEVDPYLGLANAYRSDQDFSEGEENQLLDSILPHVSELQNNPRWGELSFNVGKLYWYSYGVDDARGDADKLAAARGTRIRAASKWMKDAAAATDFDQHDSAQVYADIADFNTTVVPLINEGSDAGLYAPYYQELSNLVDQMGGETNEVMRLEVSNLALDALRTYPRKFRADGVSDQDLLALADRAAKLAQDTKPTTDLLDAEKARALAAAQPARDAVNAAFVDVEA